MWVNATYSDGTVKYKNDSLVCKTAKKAGAAFSISHWEPSSTATTAYLENLSDQIILAVSNADDGIAAAKELARQGISDAYNAAQDALSALGIAKGAQSAADKNTAAIQVTEKSIAALVEGIHFNSAGNITNINTSGLVTTDDFNVLLSKKVNFDSGGHITNISTSGLVTEAGFAQMFSERAEDGGYVKRAEISTFITEDDAGQLISNAVIEADNINFLGKVLMNGKMLVDTEGNMEINNLTANNGKFSGELVGVSGTFSELKMVRGVEMMVMGPSGMYFESNGPRTSVGGCLSWEINHPDRPLKFYVKNAGFGDYVEGDLIIMMKGIPSKNDLSQYTYHYYNFIYEDNGFLKIGNINRQTKY